MDDFTERQKTYVAFRHNLAICAEIHRQVEGLRDIPSYLVATCAADLEHRVHKQSTSDTTYRDMVMMHNLALQLAEKNFKLWQKYLQSYFPNPIVDHEDLIRPMVFANLLVADVQQSREALVKCIGSINTALSRHVSTASRLQQYYLAPKQVRELAEEFEFWDIRLLGNISRTGYWYRVLRIVWRLQFWEKKGFWNLWYEEVDRHMALQGSSTIKGKDQDTKLDKRQPTRRQKLLSGTDSGFEPLEALAQLIQGHRGIDVVPQQITSNRKGPQQTSSPITNEQTVSMERHAADPSSQQEAAQDAQEHTKAEETSPAPAPPEDGSTMRSPGGHDKSVESLSPNTSAPLEPTNDQDGVSNVETSKIIPKVEPQEEQSVKVSASSTPLYEPSQPLDRILARVEEMISHEKLRAERIAKQMSDEATNAPDEDAKLPVLQDVVVAKSSVDAVKGHDDPDPRQQSSEHAREDLATDEIQDNETVHVTELSASGEDRLLEHQPTKMQQVSRVKPTVSEGTVDEVASMSNGVSKSAAPANTSTPAAQREILLSLLQSHTVASKTETPKPTQAIASNPLEISAPKSTRHISSPTSNPYTILRPNPPGLINLDTFPTHPHTPNKISLTHASHLINLSLFLLHRSRSPNTLPSPLHEIFDASVTSINAWLDQPQIWHEPGIASALHEEVQILQDVSCRYEELGGALAGIRSCAGDDDGVRGLEKWDVYREKVDMYMLALRGLGSRIPEESGYRERFLGMLEGEEARRLREVVGKKAADDDDGEGGESGERSGAENVD